MSELSATSVDRLTRYGILDGEVTPSSNPLPAVDIDGASLPKEPQSDVFSPQTLENPSEKIKTYGAIALLTYLAGVACSKGKLNPLDGIKGIYDVVSGLVTKFFGLFKKSWI